MPIYSSNTNVNHDTLCAIHPLIPESRDPCTLGPALVNLIASRQIERLEGEARKAL